MITKTITNCSLKTSGTSKSTGKPYQIFTYQFADGTTAEGFNELPNGEHTGEWLENSNPAYPAKFTVKATGQKFQTNKKAKAMEFSVNLLKSNIYSSDAELEKELTKWQSFFESRI